MSWLRYKERMAHQGYEARQLNKRDFVAGVVASGLLNEKALAREGAFLDMQQRSVELQIEQIRLQGEVNRLETSVQRLLTLWEDPE
jgi:hypothetical protein